MIKVEHIVPGAIFINGSGDWYNIVKELDSYYVYMHCGSSIEKALRTSPQKHELSDRVANMNLNQYTQVYTKDYVHGLISKLEWS